MLLLAASCSSDSAVESSATQLNNAESSTTEPPPAEPTPAGSTATAEPSAAAPETCAARTGGPVGYALEVEGVIYDVAAYVPESLDAAEPAPIVLNWHGLGGTGPLHTVATGFVGLADSEAFVVISPTGPPLGAEAATAWELDGFDEPGRDDVAFATALIDDVVARFCGDERRVYSIGMSNGGLFTSRLICELGDRLAAAASVAGLSHPDGCQPAGAVPFVAYHGTADTVVPYDGTLTASRLDHPITAAFEGQSMSEEFAQFAESMGCESAVVTPVPPDVIRHDYVGCSDDVPVVFYEITDAGHTWPGPIPGDGTQTVDATADSWAFFEAQVLRDS